jgi:tetratricopeptide (TPR) repeat protein
MRGRLLVWPLLAVAIAALAWQTARLRSRLLASELVNEVEVVSVSVATSNPALLPRVLPGNLAALRRAAEADPVAVEVPLSRGSLFLLIRRPHDAIESYRRALALEPHPEIYLHLGDALLAAGKVGKARDAYRAAVLLDPWLRVAVPGGIL